MPQSYSRGRRSNNVYKIAASQSAIDVSSTGAVGDFIEGLLVTPTATTIGVVTLIDGATQYNLVIGGTYTLVPFYIPLGIVSVNAKWTITTGVAATVFVFGQLS